MWLFEFPNFVYHIILAIGIVSTLAGFTLNFIPFIRQYSLPLQIIGILVLVIGVYFQGGISYKEKLELKVADLKVKLAEAEAKSEKINTVVVTRVVREREIVKEKGTTVTEYIDREVIKYDDKCEIPKQVIIAHNAAAQNKALDEVLTPNTVIDTKDHNSFATKGNKK